MKKEKIKNILSNQYFILTVITFFALFVRLLNIDKPNGLWYDEMLTYVFSSKSFPFGIINAVTSEDFHMPLYYLYLGGWMKIFGNCDMVLRFSSVIWGVLTIPAFYYLGKTYRSKAVGYLLALVGCFSPVLIYYSQELRFYSMLVFFVILSVIFLLRLLDNSTKTNLILFHLINLIILYTSTIGIVFVGVEIVIIFIHFYLYKKDYLSGFIKSVLVFFTLSLPYCYLLFNNVLASYNAILDPFCWGCPNVYAPFLLLNDWLSPFMTTIGSQDPYKYQLFLKTPASAIYLFLVSGTSLCFIAGFFTSLRKPDKKLLYMITILFSFLLTETILQMRGDLIVLVRYTIIILPILLLICCSGLLSIKTKLLKYFCIAYILIIFIFNSINYKNMASHETRSGGLKTPADAIMGINPQGDYLLYPQRTELFRKYVQNLNFIDFDITRIFYRDKSKAELEKFFDKRFIEYTNKSNSLDELTFYLLDPEPTPELKKYINSAIDKMPRGKRFIFVAGPYYGFKIDFCTICNFFSEYYQPQGKDKKQKFSLCICKVTTDKKGYKKAIFHLLSGKIYVDMLKIIDENKSLEKTKVIYKEYSVNGHTRGKWELYIYKKI